MKIKSVIISNYLLVKSTEGGHFGDLGLLWRVRIVVLGCCDRTFVCFCVCYFLVSFLTCMLFPIQFKCLLEMIILRSMAGEERRELQYKLELQLFLIFFSKLEIDFKALPVKCCPYLIQKVMKAGDNQNHLCTRWVDKGAFSGGVVSSCPPLLDPLQKRPW